MKNCNDCGKNRNIGKLQVCDGASNSGLRNVGYYFCFGSVRFLFRWFGYSARLVNHRSLLMAVSQGMVVGLERDLHVFKSFET